MKVVAEAAEKLGVVAACDAVGLPRATYYRAIAKPKERAPRPTSHRAVPPEERREVLDLLHSERFVHLPLEEYKRRIRVESSPELIEQWKE